LPGNPLSCHQQLCDLAAISQDADATVDLQISAVISKLRCVNPQDSLGNIYPGNWYFLK